MLRWQLFYFILFSCCDWNIVLFYVCFYFFYIFTVFAAFGFLLLQCICPCQPPFGSLCGGWVKGSYLNHLGCQESSWLLWIKQLPPWKQHYELDLQIGVATRSQCSHQIYIISCHWVGCGVCVCVWGHGWSVRQRHHQKASGWKDKRNVKKGEDERIKTWTLNNSNILLLKTRFSLTGSFKQMLVCLCCCLPQNVDWQEQPWFEGCRCWGSDLLMMEWIQIFATNVDSKYDQRGTSSTYLTLDVLQQQNKTPPDVFNVGRNNANIYTVLKFYGVNTFDLKHLVFNPFLWRLIRMLPCYLSEWKWSELIFNLYLNPLCEAWLGCTEETGAALACSFSHFIKFCTSLTD